MSASSVAEDCQGVEGRIAVAEVEDDPGYARLLEAKFDPAQKCGDKPEGSNAATLTHMVAGRPSVAMPDLLLHGLRSDVFLQRLRDAGGDDVPVAKRAREAHFALQTN